MLARAQAESQRVGSSSALASAERALGRLHLHDGAGERATDHLAAALQRGGDGWGPDQRAETLYWLGTAYLNLAQAYQRVNDRDAAILCLKRYLKLMPFGPLAADARQRLAVLRNEDDAVAQHPPVQKDKPLNPR